MTFSLEDLPPRIRARITVEDRGGIRGPCWIGSGWNNGEGYFKARWHGVQTYLHRIVHAIAHGKDERALQFVDHLCQQRDCCNPYHTEDVPPRINIARGMNGAAQFIAPRLMREPLEMLDDAA